MISIIGMPPIADNFTSGRRVCRSAAEANIARGRFIDYRAAIQRRTKRDCHLASRRAIARR